MSQVLSGLTPNAFGSGGLKFGGGANVAVVDDPTLGFSSSLVLIEDSEDPLTEKEILGGLRRERGPRSGVVGMLNAMAFPARSLVRNGTQKISFVILLCFGSRCT